MPVRCCCRSPTSCAPRCLISSGIHPLTQAWAFKGLEPEATVEAHADDAAVSLNLWLTPDTANLDPGRGGLVICRAPPPEHWHDHRLRGGHGAM